MWAAVTEQFPSSYLLICVFALMTGQGSAAAYLSGLSTNIKNFAPQHRGKIIGLLVAAYGLSGALWTQLYSLIFKPNAIDLLFYLGIILSAVTLVCTIFLNVVPTPAPTEIEMKGAESPNSERRSLRDPAVDYRAADEQTPAAGSDTSTPDEAQPTMPSDEHVVAAEEKADVVGPEGQVTVVGTEAKATITGVEANAPVSKRRIGTDMNLIWMASTVEFWLLFVVYFAGAGCGVTVINNLGTAGPTAKTAPNEMPTRTTSGYTSVKLANASPACAIVMISIDMTTYVGRIRNNAVLLYQMNTPPKADQCYGITCFQSTFLITTGISALGCLAGVLLLLKTYRFYIKLTLKLRK